MKNTLYLFHLLSHKPQKMTTRTKVTAIMMVTIPVTLEAWQFWKALDYEVNWWMNLDYPLHIQWYFRDLGYNIGLMIGFCAMYRLSRMNEPLRIITKMLMIFGLFKIFMFFYNYERTSYSLVYPFISIFTLCSALFHKEWSLFVLRFKTRMNRYGRRFKKFAIQSFFKIIKQHEIFLNHIKHRS